MRPPPALLASSVGIRVSWNPRRAQWLANVGPGEYCVAAEEVVLTTVLGSCVAACLYEPTARIGGFNHFLLPLGSAGEPEGTALRYGVFAMERLINEILKNGGKRRNLRAKLFGGGLLLVRLADVGRRNIDFAKAYLHDEGVTVVTMDVGGEWARKLEFYPATGRARVKRLVGDRPDLAQEAGLLSRSAPPAIDGDIELF